MVTAIKTRDGGADNPRSNALRDYLQLTKPRIVVLLIFTTVTAMVIAAEGNPLQPLVLAATILGGSLAAGGASALNQFIDRDLDRQMSRTRNRPIPAGRVTPINGLIFGLALLAWSAFLLTWLVNGLTALLAMVGAVYYVFVYTILLKRNTVVNILIGGGAGAIPVLVGWAAVRGGLNLQPFLLFAIIFYWTPPHSWALALLVNSDYEEAKIPMMPAARGAEVTRLQILMYSVQLFLLTLVPVLLPAQYRLLGGFYLYAAALLGIGLLFEAITLLREASKAAARRLYRYTTMYLALLFLAMMIDQLFFRR
ncbi:MAG TPA: heme o synthase [Aggregatilineales bacterium]|nr:heme o synthase [Aggregatilineales bacterium]